MERKSNLIASITCIIVFMSLVTLLMLGMAGAFGERTTLSPPKGFHAVFTQKGVK